MDQRAFKKLAPAPAEPNSGESHSQVSFSIPGPRRNLTRNACSQCKVKKAKCDGNRPCGRCQRTGDTCVYEVNKRDIAKLQLLSDFEIAKLQRYDQVWAALQNGTDQQATELLAQIRHGKSVEALAATLNPPSAQPSIATLSSQPTFGMGTDSTSTPDDFDIQSTSTPPRSFLDLLYDREDWHQATDGVDGIDGIDGIDGVDGVDGANDASPHNNQDE
ncbi:hypothetical protein F5Y13DRAFT_32717 [Hypoxylon sp. FL1857]|nr:hypothetical protein F5Y13DRAFT_32717 [Hypoxylon sp. FL1857]